MKALEIPAHQSIDLFALNTLQECFHSRGVPQVPPNLPGKAMGFSTIVTDFWQNPSSQAFVPVPVMPVGQIYGFLRWHPQMSIDCSHPRVSGSLF